ncbi:universal stress protein [Cyanobium sp. Morenito 9A2]|uniref:universal stress protein n=1 Tax=Cyanobium sp. Morenito 9A2 TaxID=2823718 RepID=UPI0020CFC435|nr:universal stress protein [Cyanobium sp. Morenito 9A2]MCP9848612.1 universal stress protein [Cyanobium sp. Morenito 9A2]
MFRHLLVPTDGSSLSRETIAKAVAFASENSARLTFLHVQPEVFGPSNVSLFGDGMVVNPGWSEELLRANQAYASQVLQQAEALATAAGVRSEGITVVGSVIYEAILDEAKRHGCDLIFMASHGRRGLAGFLLGSETQRVLTHSSLPVLVYRTPEGP